MTFFYDLNKRMAELANKQTLAEGKSAKPDFLDIDKDGDKKEPMKKAVADKAKETNQGWSAERIAAAKQKGSWDGQVDEGFGDAVQKGVATAGAKLKGLKANVTKNPQDRQSAIDAHEKARQLYNKGSSNLKYSGMQSGNSDAADHEASRDMHQHLMKNNMEEGSTGDYSAKKAAAGKDIGKPGKAFAKIAADAAGRYGSKEKGEKVAGAVLAKLRAKEDVNEDDMEEGNEFSGALAKAKAAGASEFEVDGKKYKVTTEGFKEMDAYLAQKKKEAGTGKFDKKQISTGTVYTRRHEEEDEEDEEASDAPKKKGRKSVGAGKGKKLGAKSHGTSKLARKGSIAEQGPEGMVDRGEYGREGDMAKEQMHTIVSAAKELHSILNDEQDLPEWVQSKITKAMDYIDTARDYMLAQQAEGNEVVAEKAVSQAQRKAAGIAYAAAKGDIPKSELRGASKEMAKMPAGELKKFAKTKEKGLPEKVKETDAEPKAKGGIQFGKGIYESINSQVESMITESMNVNVSMSTGQNGEPTKSITVSAEGADAEVLAQLLNLAGMKNKSSGCGCGQTPCGCDQVEEAYGDTKPTENEPDYPTDAETTGEDDELLRRWAGGLNKPKSTGQTTIPVIASQTERQVSEQAETDKLGMNLYAELKQFKAK
jgi:hypothetical protein